MTREEIYDQLLVNKGIRNSLSRVENEMDELEDSEIVQRYIRCKHYLDKNKHLKDMDDSDILDSIIATDRETLDEIYFCYGNDFIGHAKKIGGYYIEEHSFGTLAIKHGIRVSKYRSFRNPNEVIIIPSEEAKEFESTHEVVMSATLTPEDEYLDIRRSMYIEKAGLVKKNNGRVLVRQ